MVNLLVIRVPFGRDSDLGWDSAFCSLFCCALVLTARSVVGDICSETRKQYANLWPCCWVCELWFVYVLKSHDNKLLSLLFPAKNWKKIGCKRYAFWRRVSCSPLCITIFVSYPFCFFPWNLNLAPLWCLIFISVGLKFWLATTSNQSVIIPVLGMWMS